MRAAVLGSLLFVFGCAGADGDPKSDGAAPTLDSMVLDRGPLPDRGLIPVTDMRPDSAPDIMAPDMAVVLDMAHLPPDALPDLALPDMLPPDSGASCPIGVQQPCPGCASGRQTCEEDGHWSACVGVAETCNDVDDDCDGETDEGFAGIGGDCAVGQGGCSRAGISVCNGTGDGLVCNAEPGMPMPEVCNGVDDNCNGVVDDALDGALISEDCFEGDPELSEVGACTIGRRTCREGVLSECVGAQGPVAETCDGTDEDCDGAIDEGEDGVRLSMDCYDGDDGTAGIGACLAGRKICMGGFFGVCENQVIPAIEICDGLDNDCDGDVDNVPEGGCACDPGAERGCYTGPVGTAGIGVCTEGMQICGEDGLGWGPCVGEQGPEEERCDGTDEDCDGTTDEEIAGVGVACSEGIGGCANAGQTACNRATGEIICDAEARLPGAEVCNDADDDCDGQIDEGLGLDVNCAEGVGLCQTEGITVCGPDGGIRCGAQVGEPAAERCNEIDDDCDGQIDEELGLGDPCTGGVGECRAVGQLICGEGGSTRCDAVASPAAAEQCNGLDDDCDGRIDEGNPGGGLACNTDGLGACAAGNTACTDGLIACEANVVAVLERCDGIDEDCDGSVDEADGGGPIAVSCYDGPDGTQGQGICSTGMNTCVGGVLTGCIGQTLPGVEICDRLDNDCNGEVDDTDGGCNCNPGESRGCYAGAEGTEGIGPCSGGMQTCVADGSGYGPCEGQTLPQVEQCNGIDDDCNNAIDDVAGAGDACSAGQGLCTRPGVQICEGMALVCDAVAGAPAAETCSGEDENCNGVIDDVDGLGDGCSVGQGGCAVLGLQVCQGGALACNAQAGQPGVEACNGVDDDCDGTTDEDAMGAGIACSLGLGNCQASGQQACQNGVMGCDVQIGQPDPETCNGEDDDCDGLTDEAFLGAGEQCSVGVGACAQSGVRVCRAGIDTCDATPGVPGDEICGGGDEDCDGSTDEGDVCALFATCQAALDGGRIESGVLQLQPPGIAMPQPIYCDQTTNGGGWTLVASTRDGTLNDESSDYYNDLATLAPVAAHTGIWNGLRGVGQNFDVRFVCRDNFGAINDPMTVDLTFYDVSWYTEFTTGTDAQSCFSESNGDGADVPLPARRNNLATAYLPLGTPYHATTPSPSGGNSTLEGEDTCGDVLDFTVDFSDRGMDSNQSDGTDWGEDDGTPKCGVSDVVAGQWFVFVREPRNIAVLTCDVDDLMEDNDDSLNPSPIVFDATYSGILCGEDEDWFSFEAQDGCTYTVDLLFTHADGDIDIGAFALDGSLIEAGDSFTDNESIEVQPAAGMIRIGITGFSPDGLEGFNNEYTLEVTESCP